MINLFTLFSLVLALMSLVVSVLCFHRKEQASSILGSASLCASLMTISYLASILLGTDRYMAMSIASSIYLFLHDIVLISLLFYARVYGHLEFSPMERALTFVLIFIAAVDGSWILLNPFMELGVSYVCSSNPTEGYTYIIKPFYHLHLFFSYGISIFTVVLFLVKGFSVPRELRSSYFFLPFSFVVMHATNGLYLAFPQLHEGYNYNITVWLLDIALAFIYYNSFIYSKPHMLMRFKSTLFDSLNQGVMMFDLYNNLILYNDRCDELFTGMKIHHGMKLDYFLTKSGIEKLMQDVGAPNSDNAIVTISYLTEEKEHLPLQCDYRILKNRKNKTLGRYFVFTDITNQMDLMTGYISWDSVLMKTPESDRLPTNVIACDLLGLTNINRTLGQAEGDRMLRNLADTLKQVFIGDYIFVRGQDADLYVLCYGQAESLLHNIMKEVSSLFSQRLQYAISRREESSTVASLMLRAQEGLSFRKLTDIHSNRTSSISSLVRALEECDSDTEAHVRRTQAMGEVLGRHLDIDDVQQSELAILCLLHDIGKIGVPLEILNKPGKLSEEEMIILCSHVDKGYNIARSSSELASLADMIRYHHERWDGTGYPENKRGEEIPLLSRIISVVDSYDAMISVRSYKPAMTREAALEEIARCAGTQFDPAIAQCFINLMKENPALGLPGDSLSRMSVQTVFPAPPAQNDQDRGGASDVSYSRYILNSTFSIISVDDNFTVITGYSPEDVDRLHLNHMDLIPEFAKAEYLRILSEQIQRTHCALIRHLVLRKDKTLVMVYCYGRVFYDPTSREEHSEIIVSIADNSFSGEVFAGEE